MGSVAEVWVIEDDRVLMVQQGGSGKRGLWNPVGGGVEDDETPEQAVRRESLEEVGLEPSELEFWQTVHIESPRGLLEIHSFFGKFGGRIKLEDKLLAYGWFTVQGLEELDKKGVLRHSILIDQARDALKNASA